MEANEFIPDIWYINRYGEIFQIEESQTDLTNFNYINRWNEKRARGERGNASNMIWSKSARIATVKEIQKYIKEYSFSNPEIY